MAAASIVPYGESDVATSDVRGSAARWIDETRDELLRAGGARQGTLLGDAVREVVASMALAIRADAVSLIDSLVRGSEDLVRTHEGRSLRPWIDDVRALVVSRAPMDSRPLLLALLASMEQAATGSAPVIHSHLHPEAPGYAIARAYLDALLRGDRRRASRVVREALDRGTTLSDLYIRVFSPVQREVGRLWQRGEISVADEHFCTAATQLVMSQLYDRLFDGTRRGATLVATSAPGDLHEVGIRIIADLFEMRGWDTVYLGASTPASAVADAVLQHRASLLAVSATLSSHVEGVRAVVREVRARTRGVPVLVGGAPFQIAPSLVRYVGADASAVSAEEAVRAAEALVAGPDP
jgi:methanogenic corrinoid protein MtbC1